MLLKYLVSFMVPVFCPKIPSNSGLNPRIKRTCLANSLPPFYLLVTPSFVNNFNTLAHAAYAQGRYVSKEMIEQA